MAHPHAARVIEAFRPQASDSMGIGGSQIRVRHVEATGKVWIEAAGAAELSRFDVAT